MTDEEEFEEVASKVRGKMLKKDDTLFWAKYFWLESGRRFIVQLRKDAKFAGFDIEEWEEEGG